MDTLNPNTIIDSLGGTSATARLCEVQPPSVSEWRKNGIPKTQLRVIKLLRPDLFPQEPKPKRRKADQVPPP